jgi:HK97 family phage prohead protease
MPKPIVKLEPEVRCWAGEVRASEGDSPRIAGTAIPYNGLSLPIFGLFRERFASGAFTESLENSDIDLMSYWGHDINKPLGRRSAGTLSVTDTDSGLDYEVTPGEATWQVDAVRAVRRRDVKGTSIRFWVERAEDEIWTEDPETGLWIRTIKRALLYELSPTADPAYPQTSASVRSAERAWERHLATAGAASKADKGAIDVLLALNTNRQRSKR